MGQDNIFVVKKGKKKKSVLWFRHNHGDFVLMWFLAGGVGE